MRLSISAKIFVGFLVVLATFGGVAFYGAVTMRRLGDELRLVSGGYLELWLEVRELQTSHSNLLKVIVEQMSKPDGGVRVPRFVKFAIDDARRSRLKQQMPSALEHVHALEGLRSSAAEHALLGELRVKLQSIEADFRADEEPFDEVFGPIGDAPGRTADPAAAAARLLRGERAVKRELANLAAELRWRGQMAGRRLEQEEQRAVWATLLLSLFAAAVGLAVMAIATRTLRPLRRLAERAKQIARGDYKQRVDADAPDEIGALGREFNAMAAALEQRELELIRSERLAAVGKIAAQITHEVRNPLSSIGLNAEMLDEELGEVAAGDAARLEEARALARAIVKEVDRLTEITEQYLRFARLPRPMPQREDLNALVAALLAFMRGELEARGIDAEAQLAAELPSVSIDENQLRQALLNLLRNAADSMPAGGRLYLTTAVEGAMVVLRIRDTGEGIAAENLKKVFDPFFSTKKGGTGLGLALTQQIVNDHAGTLTVASEPGRGTTFTLALPALALAPVRVAVS